MSSRSLGLISVGLPWFDVPVAETVLATTRSVLERRFTVVGPDKVVTTEQELKPVLAELRAANVMAVVFQVGTFPNGNMPAWTAEALGVPIVLMGFPEDLSVEVANNSLCGLNMATYTLTELGHPHTHVFVDPATEAGAEKLLSHVNAAVALSELRGTVVGLIGSRAPGFYPAMFDELLLRRQFGVRVEHVGLHEVTDRIKDSTSKAPPHASFPTIEGGELSAESVTWLGRYYRAITAAVEKHPYTAWAIKDWPEMTPRDSGIPAGMWPPLSWLQDDGYNISPEGDVNGAVTMELLARLTGNVPFFSDVSGVDPERSTLTLWHYGGGTKLARSRDEIRFGANGRELEFTLAPGAGVLARLGYSKGAYRLLVVEVEVLNERVTLRRAAGNAFTPRTNAADVVEEMLGGGWEHHVSFVHGDVVEDLVAFGRLAGVEVTRL